MASQDRGYDRNHSFIGNFSVLEGVMVKISDKFRPPKKVSLPAGWQPVETRNFKEFDFTFEENVIRLADQEKLQQERKIENLKVAELMQETQLQQASDEDCEDDLVTDFAVKRTGSPTKASKTVALSDIREAPILEPVRIQQDNMIAKRDTSKRRDFNFSEFEDNSATPFELVELQTLDDIDELKSVLQPEYSKKAKSISSEQSVHSRKTTDELDFSIFCTPVTTSSVKTTTTSPVATGSLLEGLGTDDSHLSQNVAPQSLVYRENTGQDIVSWGNTGRPPTQSTHTYNDNSTNPAAVHDNSIIPLESRFDLNSYKLSSSRSNYFNRFHATVGSAYLVSPVVTSVYPAQAPSQPALPSIQNSDFRVHQYQLQNRWKSQEKLASLELGSNELDPVCSDAGLSITRSTRIADEKNPHEYEITNFGFDRTNLNKASSKSLPNLAEAALVNDSPQSGNSWGENQRKSPTELVTPVVSTSRIDNIMKQFQLDRLREFEENSTNGSGTPSDQIGMQTSMVADLSARPLSRHGTLPPLQTSPRNVPYLPPTSPHVSNEKRCVSDDESNKSVGHLEGSSRERNLIRCEPLPSITTPTPFSSTSSTPTSSTSQYNNSPPKQIITKKTVASWLPDPFPSLSATEKTFVTMVAGMGFPKARIARAVLRLKSDEKEIIDFLLRVQQIAEMGFDGDDAEMALIDNKNDEEKALNYLKLVNKWKELGFPVQKIHNALTHTDRENEAVFEYLTT